MRSRASRKKLDCIFALPKWVLLFVCLLSLTPSDVIAQNENETFESAFGLNSRESIENENAGNNGLSHAKEAETPLELEELGEKEKDLTPIEKKDDEENLVQVLPETENTFSLKESSVESSPAVRRISGKMADEKNGKYVRYGKKFVINGRDRHFATRNIEQ